MNPRLSNGWLSMSKEQLEFEDDPTIEMVVPPGKIKIMLLSHCGKCNKGQVVRIDESYDAMAMLYGELKRFGWQWINGLWYCHNCAVEIHAKVN